MEIKLVCRHYYCHWTDKLDIDVRWNKMTKKKISFVREHEYYLQWTQLTLIGHNKRPLDILNQFRIYVLWTSPGCPYCLIGPIIRSYKIYVQ